MCQTGAHLFYGIKVPLVPLAIAKEAFLAQCGTSCAIDLIIARRRKGILRGMASGLQPEQTVFQVPEEVWMLIKDELAVMLWEEAEDSLIRDWHDACAHKPSRWCKCTVCLQADASGEQNALPRRFTFKHVKDCGSCIEVFDIREGTDALRFHTFRRIETMLDRFGLTALDIELTGSGARLVLTDAVVAVILPQYASTWSEVDHMGIPQHNAGSLFPAFFALPTDADDRFNRFLRYFPELTVESKDCGDGKIVGVSSTSQLAEETDRRPAEQAGGRRAQPAWGLSVWSDRCGWATDYN
ncbi:hypothetical protein JCM10450v2_001294 [Rhodotorula kratochvilovae]